MGFGCAVGATHSAFVLLLLGLHFPLLMFLTCFLKKINEVLVASSAVFTVVGIGRAVPAEGPVFSWLPLPVVTGK